MTLGAHVHSIDALLSFKASLERFVAHVDRAMGEADMEIQRVTQWITHDQAVHWKTQIREREKQVARAKDDLRRVLLSLSEHTPSAVEQKKALKHAQDALEEAHRKSDATQHWRHQLDRAVNEYRGQTQLVRSAADADLPRAASVISRHIDHLHEYLAVAPPAESGPAGTADGAGAPDDVLTGMGLPPARRRSITLSATEREIEEMRALRSRAPDDATRSALIVEPLPPCDRGDEPLNKPLACIEPLQARRQPPRPGDIVVYEPAALNSVDVYILRREASTRGDSGWFMGAMEPARDAIRACTVSRLLLRRPDLREILTLPDGFLVRVKEGSIVLALDAHDQERWASRHASATGTISRRKAAP